MIEIFEYKKKQFYKALNKALRTLAAADLIECSIIKAQIIGIGDAAGAIKDTETMNIIKEWLESFYE